MAAISDVYQQDDAADEAATTFESASGEIRAALCLTRRAADADLSFAVMLQDQYPLVWEALRQGRIDYRRARTIVWGVSHLPPDAATGTIERVIDEAHRLTSGQLAHLLRRLCIESDPVQAARRYQQAVDERRVLTEPTTAGTVNLMGLELPPDRVAEILSRINRLAKTLKTSEESRTIDQLRADIFLDLLTGASTVKTGSLEIRVDLETLCALADHPGELVGYGPVIADIARQIAVHCQEWRYTITHPETRQPIQTGHTRRRPHAGQRRLVEARNTTCVFPGCRQPATQCDLDHQIPWANGGATSVDNLTPLCRHDHRLKHKAGWTYRTLANGDYQWHSPLGHTYINSSQPP